MAIEFKKLEPDPDSGVVVSVDDDPSARRNIVMDEAGELCGTSRGPSFCVKYAGHRGDCLSVANGSDELVVVNVPISDTTEPVAEPDRQKRRPTLHKPSGSIRNKGTWQSLATVERYVKNRRKKNKAAKAARKRNRK